MHWLMSILMPVVCMWIVVSADQFLFFDQTATWKGDCDYDAKPRFGPTNWKSPVDYVNGKVYMRHEVTNKPTTKKIAVQMCMWQSGGPETCASCKDFTQDGVYYYEWGPPSGWWNLKPIDYTKAFSWVCVVYKDGSCGGKLFQKGCCGSHCYTGSDLAQHVGWKFRATVYVVSKGATFAPPAEWTGCPDSWGCGSAVAATPRFAVAAKKDAPDIRALTGGGFTIRIPSDGEHVVEVFRPDGARIAVRSGEGSARYTMQRGEIGPGIYIAISRTVNAVSTWRVIVP